MTSRPSPRSGSRRGSRSARARRRPASARLRRAAALGLAAIAALAGCGGGAGGSSPANVELTRHRFDSAAAFRLITAQVAVGQRPAGSPQLERLAEGLRRMLPDGRFEPVPGGLRNIVGTIPGSLPAILIGAHYDTEYHPKGFVGADDSAAGTAAVIELGRTLRRELAGTRHRQVRLVLFDGEEEPPGCPNRRFARCALRGSRAYVKAHPGEIGEMILLDYVANRGLRIPREANSDRALWARLRAAGQRVGAGPIFPDTTQTAILDDTTPFLEAGVPAIDLIDFSYRYADTVKDTPDKLSEADLDAVGETVAELALELAGPPQP